MVPQSYFFPALISHPSKTHLQRKLFFWRRADTGRIDKLSGSDDRPFYQRKISVVECFDVHESLLLMLSSNTEFNASLLSSRMRGHSISERISLSDIGIISKRVMSITKLICKRYNLNFYNDKIYTDDIMQ